jgi:hypothetical protein
MPPITPTIKTPLERQDRPDQPEDDNFHDQQQQGPRLATHRCPDQLRRFECQQPYK